ncbi:MAG: hypothetical protein K2N73_12790 [Lachnospiraceae bacterium]|nr:hypothetical protein [Lachnospiraceae bacterium]
MNDINNDIAIETIENESTDQDDTSVFSPIDTKAMYYGECGDLGCGYLAYSISDRDDEDYKLCFFKSEDGQKALSEVDFDFDEADYVFPDARDNNTAIGKFVEIYYSDMVDITKNGSGDLLIVARYEKEDKQYFDTRVYELKDNNAYINNNLCQELNEKYADAEDFPVEEVIAMPHD